MLTFFTSLSFLYIFSVLLMTWYGTVYYRNFTRNGYQPRLFPWLFSFIAAACFFFLFSNMHPPLKLKTFSNLDHHFIRLDGYRVAGQVELGRTDTLNHKGNPFSRFVLSRENGQLSVVSAYSEEPFYTSSGGTSKLLSASYPATGHTISFRVDSLQLEVSAVTGDRFLLSVNGKPAGSAVRKLKKGLTAWAVFQDDTLFMNTPWYSHERISDGLKSIILLRDNFSGDETGELKFFLSGRLFRTVQQVKYDHTTLQGSSVVFSASLENNSLLGWGLGFPEKNKNQFYISSRAVDSFRLACRYPVAYPLAEEPVNNDHRSRVSHEVIKFLISNEKQVATLPAVFNEGFLFPAFTGDSTMDFSPVLLSYQKDKADEPLNLKARSINGPAALAVTTDQKLIVPARAAGLSWEFSIANSFNWKFGRADVPAKTWKLLLFGSLLFFFAMVFFSSLLKPAYQLSWVWQVLSCVVMLLLTTRFFLYWRYKSFPPYEGLDAPSLQQLNSFWNFGIIVFVSLLLGVVFGAGLLQFIFTKVAKGIRHLSGRSSYHEHGKGIWKKNRLFDRLSSASTSSKLRPRVFFWGSWIVILLASGGLAAATGFNPATCRHLATVLIILYFVFTHISCKFSPLASAADSSWWSINTSRPGDIVISNPAKVLLSLSLLGLFSFIDIGFALIFLNFLLFNEAFLLINYSIAGLSAGSRRNASLFGLMAILYLLAFAANLVYGPYIFRYVLELPRQGYTAGYIIFAVLVSYSAGRLLQYTQKKKRVIQAIIALSLFGFAFLFFPKEEIRDKAAMTKYRIDVLTMPADQVIEKAYGDGDSYEPVIRAAQNQWFINTFIDEENNPAVNRAGFQLLPHAPQNRGAKYNAQATDLVTSRFLIAEHGRWAVLFYVLLLLLPVSLLASFYKLYPDFTNRINPGYASVTTGFAVLNYLLITALLVILAATGRYIFFGQDLPFGSILSKQSVLFPSVLIIAAILFFRNLPLQQYPNRKKLLPGAIIFTGLLVLLFFVKPVFNRNKEFGVAELAKNMDSYIQSRLQPVWDDIDTARATRRLSLVKKDHLFSFRVKEMAAAGALNDASVFFLDQLKQYYTSGFSKHLDQGRMLYLDMNTGKPRLAVNDSYFHVEAPPHLQQLWRGNVFGDTANYNISVWDMGNGAVEHFRAASFSGERGFMTKDSLGFVFKRKIAENLFEELCLVNNSGASLVLSTANNELTLKKGDTLALRNPDRIYIRDIQGNAQRTLLVQPDAFMKNYYVNGSRFYYYPLGNDFTWARNFAESISSGYAGKDRMNGNVFISLDAVLTDSVAARIRGMMELDTAYKTGAEYAICLADGNGRLIAMPDHIKGFNRPDPNSKAEFNKAIRGENGFISQSDLRKKIGNGNLLRLNPGPGSTLKPVIFAAIASQLDLDWDSFASEGFSEKQQFFGGEKVAEYDFEKNNGRINSVVDYIKYSDNYYHSNLLLLGSYSKQSLQALLLRNFLQQNPDGAFHWPYFTYKGQSYWLNGFEKWPGYAAGKANFGSDSSFVSVGLFNNFGVHTYRNGKSFDRFISPFDSAVFGNAYTQSGFILPEYALFDQKGTGMNLDRPNEVFMSSFRGHVKGSSQVMLPPVKMLDVYGKLASQNRNYSLTLNPYASEKPFTPFSVDAGVTYSNYLSLMKESVFTGMREALFKGTAARLGGMLKQGAPYYYYAKTGTTGDDELTTKSKLFTLIISEKDMASPDFNFRKNRFFIIYFTSQNGPPKQNEEFQAEIIRLVERSPAFQKYMHSAAQ